MCGREYRWTWRGEVRTTTDAKDAKETVCTTVTSALSPIRRAMLRPKLSL